MRVIYTALLILFVLMVLVFCVQNLSTVSVNYLGWSMSVPMPLLILLVYVFGMVSGWGVLAFLRRSLVGASRRPDQET